MNAAVAIPTWNGLMPAGRRRVIAEQENALKTFDQIVVRLGRCPDPARASSDDGLHVGFVTDRFIESLNALVRDRSR